MQKIALKSLFVVPALLVFLSAPAQDTLRSFLLPQYLERIYPVQLKHKKDGIVNKIVTGSVYVSAYNIAVGTGLTMSSEKITKWYKKDKFTVHAILKQYERSFTTPPVIDKDLFVINYLGHPYQGAFYYNALRSQGATPWQSFLFSAAHSTLWEYAWEGGIEQPSIQDLIVTPILGTLLGELSHVLTLKMSHNGFRWYEKVLVVILDPAYAINNGFKTRTKAQL